MIETIIGILIIGCILSILLGMPFMLVVITKWENDSNHWWPVTNEHIASTGFRSNIFTIFSGIYFFYFIYGLVKDPESFKPESEFDYFMYGISLLVFIMIYGGAILKGGSARKHILVCGFVLALAMLTLLQNLSIAWAIHILVVLISIFMGYKLLLLEAFELRAK
jgi:hypothetical protein